MATFGTTPGAANTKQASIAPTDCNVSQAGNDGISSLSWSPTANILVSGNWDSGVRCWEVADQAGQIQANPKAQGESFCWMHVLIVMYAIHTQRETRVTHQMMLVVVAEKARLMEQNLSLTFNVDALLQ